MDITFAAGLGCTLLGLVGYAAGIAAPYPGRAFSVTALMVGVTLLAIGDWGQAASADHDTDHTDAAPTDGGRR